MKRMAMLLLALILATEGYQVAAQEAKTEEKPVKIGVEVKKVEAQPVVQMRFKTTVAEMPAKLGAAYGAIMGHIAKYGGERTMMPLSRYYAIEGDTFDMAAAIAVVKPVKGEGTIESSELPAGLVASTWHVGPYEKLSETHAALRQWLTDNGHELGGEFWEIYWTDPGTEPDPKKWRTEIVQQLKK